MSEGFESKSATDAKKMSDSEKANRKRIEKAHHRTEIPEVWNLLVSAIGEQG